MPDIKPTINWDIVWEKFNFYTTDPIMIRLDLFSDWKGTFGQSGLLRTIFFLNFHYATTEAEWTTFERKFMRWWKNGQNLPCPPSWENQKEWIQNYFDNL